MGRGSPRRGSRKRERRDKRDTKQRQNRLILIGHIKTYNTKSRCGNQTHIRNPRNSPFHLFDGFLSGIWQWCEYVEQCGHRRLHRNDSEPTTSGRLLYSRLSIVPAQKLLKALLPWSYLTRNKQRNNGQALLQPQPCNRLDVYLIRQECKDLWLIHFSTRTFFTSPVNLLRITLLHLTLQSIPCWVFWCTWLLYFYLPTRYAPSFRHT